MSKPSPFGPVATASLLSKRLLSLGLGTALVGSLSGCILVTDTSRMNIDVFQDEVAPVWYDAANAPTVVEPAAPQRRDLYRTKFHQTYGLPVSNPLHRTLYGVMVDDGHTLPAIPLDRVRSDMLRQEVSYQTVEAPGTIVVDTKAH
ncbi:MAG: hypothetical protein ACK4Z8_17070, partial [Novosphingobium sp.]